MKGIDWTYSDLISIFCVPDPQTPFNVLVVTASADALTSPAFTVHTALCTSLGNFEWVPSSRELSYPFRLLSNWGSDSSRASAKAGSNRRHVPHSNHFRILRSIFFCILPFQCLGDHVTLGEFSQTEALTLYDGYTKSIHSFRSVYKYAARARVVYSRLARSSKFSVNVFSASDIWMKWKRCRHINILVVKN